MQVRARVYKHRAACKPSFVGQVCLMTDYVLLTSDDVAERFARALKTQIENAFGEHPKKSPAYGRIINEMHWK